MQQGKVLSGAECRWKLATAMENARLRIPERFVAGARVHDKQEFVAAWGGRSNRSWRRQKEEVSVSDQRSKSPRAALPLMLLAQLYSFGVTCKDAE